MKSRTGALACLPGPALAALADRCADLGDPGAEALRAAGRVAGGDLFELIGSDPAGLPVVEFWMRVDEKLRELNLGSLRFEPIDPGLATISWYGFPEGGAPDGSGRQTRGCQLATGLLAGLLGRAADRPVGVVEIGCGASSPHACYFLVGPESRLAAVRGRVAEGASVAEAVGAS